VTRYAAPAALLFVVTAAVLALHYTVQRPAHTAPVVTTETAPKVKHVKRTAAITRTYVVQRGDSFSTIAVKTHTSVARLERLNPGVSTTALRVGERIKVK